VYTLHPASGSSTSVIRIGTPTYMDSVCVAPVAVFRGRYCRIAPERRTPPPSRTASTAAVLLPPHRAPTFPAGIHTSSDESTAPIMAQAIVSPPSGLSDHSPSELLASWYHPTSLVSVHRAPAVGRDCPSSSHSQSCS